MEGSLSPKKHSPDKGRATGDLEALGRIVNHSSKTGNRGTGGAKRTAQGNWHQRINTSSKTCRRTADKNEGQKSSRCIRGVPFKSEVSSVSRSRKEGTITGLTQGQLRVESKTRQLLESRRPAEREDLSLSNRRGK